MPNPSGARAARKDEEDSVSAPTIELGQTQGTSLREGAFGNATALSCRECGHQVELGPTTRVRSASGRWRSPTTSRA